MRSSKNMETFTMVCPPEQLAIRFPDFEHLEFLVVADNGQAARRIAADFSSEEYGANTADVWLYKTRVCYEASTPFFVEEKGHLCGIISRKKVLHKEE